MSGRSAEVSVVDSFGRRQGGVRLHQSGALDAGLVEPPHLRVPRASRVAHECPTRAVHVPQEFDSSVDPASVVKAHLNRSRWALITQRLNMCHRSPPFVPGVTGGSLALPSGEPPASGGGVSALPGRQAERGDSMGRGVALRLVTLNQANDREVPLVRV